MKALQIGNYRYVVIGRNGNREWAIHATDMLTDARKVLKAGRTVDRKHWEGVRIFDRRTQSSIYATGK